MKYSKNFFLRNGHNLLIRSANVQDAGDLIVFLKDVFSETEFLDLTSEEFNANEPKQKDIIKFYTASPNSVMLLAIYNDEIVGISTLTGKLGVKLSHRAVLGLSVKKRYWGIGIGYSLMTSSIECSLTSPIFKIELEVVTTNTRAINLYKKFGFSIDGIIKYAKIHRNKVYDHYIMSNLIKEIQ